MYKYTDENDRNEKINKAKKDIMEAMKSIEELTENDKFNLMKELIETEMFLSFFNQMRK